MPFQIISGDIQTSYGEARVEPFPDRTGAAEAQIHPLKGMDQAREYDEIGTVCISEYSLTRAGQGDCRYVIKTPLPDDAASLRDPDIIRHCYRSALQIVRDFGLKSVAFPLIGVTGNGRSKELALHIAAEEIRSFLNELTYVIIVLPAADCGSSSTALSCCELFSILGITSVSINLFIKVDLPVLTGPTTPM